MKHTHKLASLSFLLCTQAFAQPVYQPPGQNLTYGPSSNKRSIMSNIANPAAAAAMSSKEDNQYHVGLLSLGFGYELGKLDNVYNQVDSTSQQLKTAQNIPASSLTSTAAVADYLNKNVITPINALTSAFQKDATATVYGAGSVPFTPFAFSSKALGGSLVFDANASMIGNVSFLADPFASINATDPAVVKALTTGTYTLAPNDSSAVIKTATVQQLGVGYSRSVLTRAAAKSENADASSGGTQFVGDLTAGVRMKYYRVTLARDAVKLSNLNGTQNTLNNGSQASSSSTGWGLDVGTLWNSTNYRVGAWVNNLNKPSFEYNTINTTGYTNTTLITQLNADGRYEMTPQLQLEGAVFTDSQDWIVNVAMDGNAVKDPIGRDFQWATLSAAYVTDSWWIPGVRLGYRSNTTGTKLNYLTGGLTLFKGFSLDFARSMDTVSDGNGGSVPRSFMINLSLQMTF